MAQSLGVRISVSPERALTDNPHHTRCEIENYVDEFLKFMKQNGMEILQTTLGVHQHSGSRSHAHFHMILGNEFPFKSPPLQMFKSYLKKRPQGEDIVPVVLEMKKCVSIHVRKIPMMEETDTTNTTDRWLQYPLKEGNIIEKYCKTHTSLQVLADQATAEYASVCIKREKALNATMKTHNQKQIVIDLLTKFYPTELKPHQLDAYTMIDKALTELAQADIPYKKIIEHSAQYCYTRNTNFGSTAANEFLINSCIKGLKKSALWELQNPT